jgi:hypothetical protein
MDQQLFSNEQFTICSVFFQALEAQRDYSPTGRPGFLRTFRMPAVKSRDSYELLLVTTHWQDQRNGSEQRFTSPVFADELAKDLVTNWRDQRQFLEMGRPGIMVIAGTTPTPEELETMHRWQDAWCEAFCIEAEDMNANGKKSGILQLHRDCAIHIGRESAEWVYNLAPTSLISCPMCAARIDSASIVCRECRNVVDFDRYLQRQQKQAEIEARVKELKANNLSMPDPATQARPLPPVPPIPRNIATK